MLVVVFLLDACDEFRLYPAADSVVRLENVRHGTSFVK